MAALSDRTTATVEKAIVACLREQFSIGEPASFDAIVRMLEPKMLGAGRARARRLASVIAELLGAEPTGSTRDALDAIRADAALLSRMRPLRHRM